MGLRATKPADLFDDMSNSAVIREKVQNNDYAQNLYAAMCNMRWQRTDVWPILSDEVWSVSWRASGGLVAELRNLGEDYLDYYCSGMGGFAVLTEDDEQRVEREFKQRGFVPEGVVTDEIRKDLADLGWHPVPWADED